MRLIADGEGKLFSDRLEAETTRAGATYEMSAAGVEATRREGGFHFIDPDDPSSVVYCYHDPNQRSSPTFPRVLPERIIWVQHLHGRSAKVLDIFLSTIDLCQSFGFELAKFKLGGPYAQLAADLTGATREPDGTWAVPFTQARERVVAAIADRDRIASGGRR